MNFTDPTGHYPCEGADGIRCTPTPPPTPFESDLIDFTAVEGESWTEDEMRAVHAGAYATAQALARAENQARWEAHKNLGTPYEPIGWYEAYMKVYGGKVNFHKTGTECASGCWGSYGITTGNRTGINVYTNATGITNDAGDSGYTLGELWAVHELGHAFEARLSNREGQWGVARTALRDDLNVTSQQGFASDGEGPDYWRQNPNADFGEQFADSFLGWVYNQWADSEQGAARRNFMNRHMPYWVSQFPAR